MDKKSKEIVKKRFEWAEGHKIHGAPVTNGRCIICDTTTGYFQWNKNKLGYECTECLGEIVQSLREFGDEDIPTTTTMFRDYCDDTTEARTKVSLSDGRSTRFDV